MENNEKLLVLDRQRWARGEYASIRLLDTRGKMCCLGFCMAQNGFPAKDLLDNGEPAEAAGNRGSAHGCPEYLVSSLPESCCDEDEDGSIIPSFCDTNLTTEAMSINDDTLTSDEQKIEQLNQEFSKVGIQVILVDTPEQCEALGGLRADFAKDLTHGARS